MANNAENEADCARDQNDGILATLLKCKNYSEIKKVVDANSVFSGFDFPIDTTEGGGKKGPKSPKYVEMCKQAAQAWIKGAGASKGNTEHDIAPYDQCLHGLTALLSASSLPPDLREHLVRAFEATEGRVKELQDGLKKVAHEQRETKREVARLASRPAPPTPAVEPTRQEKRETAARSAEEHFKEQGERDERKLDLRVRVMGGKTPTPGDEARSTLQTMLHERLGFSEGEAKSIMDCYVGRVLVLQAKTGFTLLVTFKDDKDEWMRAPCFGREKTAKEVQAWVYAHAQARLARRAGGTEAGNRVQPDGHAAGAPGNPVPLAAAGVAAGSTRADGVHPCCAPGGGRPHMPQCNSGCGSSSNLPEEAQGQAAAAKRPLKPLCRYTTTSFSEWNKLLENSGNCIFGC
jgi:hypothetical protein